ncbi:MAG TPA: nitroreductase/quinone reductase family protein [Acidimicrobiales bacterium]|nr:nitroreductase/quinone reductase family protein [Acidimicrobiales bacterium]
MTTLTSTPQEAPMETNPTPTTPHYQRPDWFTRNVFNRLVKGFTRLGISVRGSRVLEHRGRTSGRLHHTPVNLLTYEGQRYLVAPRGDTQWVRNVRSADGHLVLILGRHREHCTATEIPVESSVPILRSYLEKWAFETGMFFGGITADANDADWAVEAPRHPVFALTS